MPLKSLLLIFFYTFSLESFSQASASANFTASVTIIEPIGISTASNMRFSNIDAGSGGTVILKPDHTRLSVGGAELKSGGEVSAATFLVSGQQGYAFSVSLPQGSHQVTSGEAVMRLEDFTTDYQGAALAGEGETIRVGASLVVAPNQQPGYYQSSENLQVTVNYN